MQSENSTMEYGLSETVLQKIKDVFISFPEVEEAIIYGSRAMGNYRQGSDIDITLKGKVDFKKLLQIEKEIDDKMLPYSFDISVYHKLSNPELVEHINRVGKKLYVKEKV